MENIELLHSSFLFRGMKDRQIETALKKLGAEEKRYRKNSFLITKGQENIRLGLLIEGNAVIFQDDVWGKRTFIESIKAGQTFACPYAASSLPSDICVQASSTCNVLWLNVSKLNFAGNDSVLLLVASNLLQEMAFNLLRLNKRLFHVSKKTTKEKLMSYLSSKADESNSLDVVIPLDRKKLAEYLCVERSAMSAEISALVSDGKISKRKKHFILYP